MARLAPDSTKTRVIFASKAEEQVYSECRKLSEGWRVYYSCTLSANEDDQGLKDNEIDFLCYHPRGGIVVIEVKGGRIRRDADAEQYYSVNRHGEEFKIKDPFKQALVWKSRFVRYLRTKGIKVPVTHAVCLPSVVEQDFPETTESNHSILIGRDRLKNLELSLKTIVEAAHPPRFLNFEDVGSELDKLLVGPSFTTKLYLRDYLDSHEHRVKDVETIHETLITPIASSRRLGIEGEAGTGKTMLAILLAKHLRDTGSRVLILSSNALLNLWLREEAGSAIDALTYTDVASSYGVNLLIPPKDFEGDKDDWVQYEAPERLRQATAKSSKKYDAIICDEAQDVQPFWWDSFESLLDDSTGEDRLYVFFDSSQGVFGSGGSDGGAFIAEDVLPIPAPYFPLVHNYRTTREIAAVARAFRTGRSVLQSHSGRLGYVPELIVYRDPDHARELLTRLTRKLTQLEGLAADEITLLSARNPAAKESVLYKTETLGGLDVHRLSPVKKDNTRNSNAKKGENDKKADQDGSGKDSNWSAAKAPSGSLAVSTIAGFKGMETPVGILINISEYNLPVENAIMSSLIYVACSRAKHMLYIFVKEGDPKVEAFQKALSSVQLTGTMVLEGSAADFEFVGTVTHYNPDRVGWLEVKDPGFQQGQVMFFPSDVEKANLSGLVIGSRIKFRPRVEGRITIACDLGSAVAVADPLPSKKLTLPTVNEPQVAGSNKKVTPEEPVSATVISRAGNKAS